MSHPARAHDLWADDFDTPVPSRRRRREAVSWASAEDLEILGGIGRDSSANWTVLTLDGDDGEDLDMFEDADVAEARFVDPRLDDSRPTGSEADATWADPSFFDTAGVDEPTGITWRLPGRFRRTATARPAVARERERPVRLIDHEATPVDFISEPPAPLLPGQRRTVVIRGRVPAPVAVTPPDRRRPAPRTRDRVGHRPDRVALWAFVLGLLLIIIAVLSAGGSA